jgi:DMSO/TMAO reductase YedYZ molybdopterin-dependent catalytic subunit
MTQPEINEQEKVPPGQKYIKSFIYYAALGVPQVDLNRYRLTISGNVKKNLSFTYQELTSWKQVTVAKDFHCVTSWSIKGTVWEGVPMSELFNLAGALTDTRWVMFKSLDGYTTPVPFEDASSPQAIVALKLNGKPLEIEMGFPARPFIPHLYGWKSAKWLTEIELLKEYVDGYWEERGYNERGNVWEEERFKSWGRHLRRSVIGR